MEKILTIDGRQVRFKATAALPLHYKAQFGRDMFADIAVVNKSWHPEGAGGYFDETLDMSLIYNLIWTMAKAAEPGIKPPLEWYDEFDTGLPVFNCFAELSDMLMRSIQGTQKN